MYLILKGVMYSNLSISLSCADSTNIWWSSFWGFFPKGASFSFWTDCFQTFKMFFFSSFFSSSQSCRMWPAIRLPRTGANADHIFESNLSPACAVFAFFKHFSASFSTKKSLPPLCEKKNIDRSVSIPFWRKLSDLMAKPPKGGGTCSGCLLSHCNPTA